MSSGAREGHTVVSGSVAVAVVVVDSSGTKYTRHDKKLEKKDQITFDFTDILTITLVLRLVSAYE